MGFRRYTPPLHFEPLSPRPSDILPDFPDTEDKLDEAARVAKRRRIEKLGQDYLEGKQLFILSAGLKGPFNDGWVNPWKTNPKPGNPACQRGNVNGRFGDTRPELVAIPESIPKRTKRYQKPPARRQGSGFESSLEPQPAQQHQVDKLQRKGGKEDRHRAGSDTSTHDRKRSSNNNCKQRLTSPPKPHSASARRSSIESDSFSHGQRRPSNTLSKQQSVSAKVNSVAERHRSLSHRASADGWLRTDGRTLRPQAYEYEHLNPSSPTPSYRQRSSRKSQQDRGNKRQRLDHLDDRNRSPDRHWDSFTPFNGPQSESLLGNHEREFGPDKPSRKSAKSPEGRSRFFKPGKPASALSAHPNGKEKRYMLFPDGKRVSALAQPGPTREASQSPRVVPPSDHLPEFQYRRIKKPSEDSASNSNSEGKPRRQSQAKRDTPQQENTQKTNGEICHTSAPGPSLEGTHDFHDHISTAASEIIPSAQIVPGQSRLPNPLLSLYSTNFSGGNTGAAGRGSQSEGYDDQVSTQAAIAIAQKSLQDDLASPAKDTTSKARIVSQGEVNLPRRSPHTNSQDNAVSSQVKPLNLFDTPDSQRAKNDHRWQDPSTQTMLNSMTPFDFSTVKRTKPWRKSDGDWKKSEEHMNLEFPDEPLPARLRIGTESISPKSTSARPSQARVPGLRQFPSNASTDPPPAEESSEFTILPFNLAASSNATGQQDGQGHGEPEDNFNLSQAIADAGTFLGSWDFERMDAESNNNTDGNRGSKMLPPSCSSGTKAQSILKPNMPGR
ncbi:hypothetical protein AJ79_08768 [Helicocarpus griseus UAMH5409]|uniref:Uncharacterized protein n=1 Tax=Helicocarpus griseus UAMH5409 TaxID=1447875 RepID=A0A2B7WQ89_9EURO|nr:hypothetical protein AJ79_08768 [Helicocarpus griseus UAMH5409]